MLQRKIGAGTISLFLCLIGLIWGWNFGDICFGDNVLNYFGLKAWANGNTGTHLTLLYALVVFIPAFVLGSKYKNNLGARAGRMISMIMGVIILSSCVLLQL